MPRRPAASIDALVAAALQDVVKQASVSIARAVADLAASQLTLAIEGGVAKGRRRRAAAGPRRVAAVSRWAADRRARRVPNFVIALTGLKTKRQVVQRYGEGAVFEKGKAAPRAR